MARLSRMSSKDRVTTYAEDSLDQTNGVGSIIRQEQEWRSPPSKLKLPGGGTAGIILSRWSAAEVGKPMEVYQDSVEDAHVISFAVRSTHVDFIDAHCEVRDTMILPRTILLSPPTDQPRGGAFRRPYDIFRAYVSQELIRECWETTRGVSRTQNFELFPTHFCRDGSVRQLMTSLLNAHAEIAPLDLAFTEALGLALASQLLRIHADRRPSTSERTRSLTNRQLNRVIDFIEAHLSEPIYLANLAGLVGLNRMYFAAQFRATTGLAPQAFILQRRIARAQMLLMDASLPISQVALSTGFSSQAHLTYAFRKAVGNTPSRWRQAQLGGLDGDRPAAGREDHQARTHARVQQS